MQLKNDLLLRVAKGQPVERPPVWLMRQAGRFLSEYREVRAKAGSFRNMIANPDVAAEVTLQPVDLVGVDAAIIFSDILVIPEAMGLPYEMIEKKGPFFPETIRSEADLKKLRPVPEESNLDHTYEALRIVKKELKGRVPLIGFAGAPWTIFCYMTEGSGSKTFSIAKSILYREPAFASQLIDQITTATISYLQKQIECGADIVQIFDSWAGILNREMYEAFALPAIDRICNVIQEVPKIVFSKGAFHSLDLLGELDCQVLGLDWTIEPEDARRLAPGKAFQGNLDPCALYGSIESVRKRTKDMIQKFEPGRHIVNLGHGIYPDLPREHVIEMVRTVKGFEYATSSRL